MKNLLSAFAMGAALTLTGAGMSSAVAAPANTSALSQENAGQEKSRATDFSAQRRHHGHGHHRHFHGHRHFGHRHGYYAPRYYARPYAYRPYGYYGGPYAYGGPSIGFGPGFGIGFGFGPRW